MLTLERFWCLEEIQGVSNSFISIETTLDPFGYYGSSIEKEKRLVQVVDDKDGALGEADWSLEVTLKQKEELEKTLKES